MQLKPETLFPSSIQIPISNSKLAPDNEEQKNNEKDSNDELNRHGLWMWKDIITTPILQLIKNLGSSQKDSTEYPEPEPGGCFRMPPFTPYYAKVPWHKGTREILSGIFPKYGNYCGPNYSSGRSGGSLVWDKPPVDWLDYCCFQHDVGYDTYSQLELYKADIAFLQCLVRMPKEKISPANPGGYVRETYRTLSILGLKRFLIPYRRMLLQQHKIESGLTPKLDTDSQK